MALYCINNAKMVIPENRVNTKIGLRRFSKIQNENGQI